jgi:TonB family protein
MRRKGWPLMAAKSRCRAVLVVLAMMAPEGMPVQVLAQTVSPQPACTPIALAATQSPPTLNPPAEWQGRAAVLRAMVAPEGRVESVALAESSGAVTLDQAAMAHVKQAWRWQPMLCNTGSTEQRVTLRIPVLGCVAQPVENTITAPDVPPLARGEGRTAGAAITVGADGRVRSVRITRSSGDEKLDAAAVAHVQSNWRYWPLGVCASVRALANIAFPVVSCEAVPLRETQTAPDTEPLPEGQARSADLRVAIGPDGRPQRVAIARSSGMAELDQAGIEQVRRVWRWQPFVCDGKAAMPESLETMVSIQFPVIVP